MRWAVARGAAGLNPDTQPPLQTPPKVLLPAFLPVEIWGETAGAGGTEQSFLGIQNGGSLFCHPMCVHSTTLRYPGKCSAKVAQSKHFPVLWCQLTAVLTRSSALVFFSACLPPAQASRIRSTPSHASQELEADGACGVRLSLWPSTSQCHQCLVVMGSALPESCHRAACLTGDSRSGADAGLS